ncbi:MAG TPA: substrate-binding domain-containing protein, partial [Thermomicrobiales bacterium]|nr:substrate-binding domain-containing protein [Thermomicrobiales bacterium]
VQLGEADAGIVYETDVTPDVAEDVRLIPIPDGLNIIAEYPIVALSGGDTGLAGEFIELVLSEEGQEILARWGFRAGETG